MKPPVSADEGARTLDTLARLAAGAIDLDTAAACLNRPAEQILDVLDSPEGVRAVAAHMEHMRSTGGLMKAKALPLIDRLLDRVETQIADGEVSASAAPKLLDTLLKLTGIAEERAAHLRAQIEPERPNLSIIFLHEGETAPPSDAAHQIVVQMPGPRPGAERIIDVPQGAAGGDDAE